LLGNCDGIARFSLSMFVYSSGYLGTPIHWFIAAEVLWIFPNVAVPLHVKGHPRISRAFKKRGGRCRYIHMTMLMCTCIYLSIYQPTCLHASLSVRPSVRLFVCLSICLSIYLSTCLSTYFRSIYLSVCLPASLSMHLCTGTYV
jgi:hypothetical protein